LSWLAGVLVLMQLRVVAAALAVCYLQLAIPLLRVLQLR
jgi:hypothetical protein